MLVDWFCILVWVAITAAVGVPLYLSGVTHSVGAVASNLVAALMMVLPTTVVLTLLGSSPREASIGKRTRHLRVVDAVTGSRVSFQRSILRKWGLHLGTLGAWSTPREPSGRAGLPGLLRGVACLVRSGLEVPGVPGLDPLARRAHLSRLRRQPWVAAVRRQVAVWHLQAEGLRHRRHHLRQDPHTADRVVHRGLAGGQQP